MQVKDAKENHTDILFIFELFIVWMNAKKKELPLRKKAMMQMKTREIFVNVQSMPSGVLSYEF